MTSGEHNNSTGPAILAKHQYEDCRTEVRCTPFSLFFCGPLEYADMNVPLSRMEMVRSRNNELELPFYASASTCANGPTLTAIYLHRQAITPPWRR